MAKEHKKEPNQDVRSERIIQNIVLSRNTEKKIVRYKVVKIQQNVIIRRKKADTLTTAVQSRKQTNNSLENIQKISNISKNINKKGNTTPSNTNKRTTSGEKSDDNKYIEAAKLASAKEIYKENTDAELKTSTTGWINKASAQQSVTESQRKKAAEINERLKSNIAKSRSEGAIFEAEIKAYAISKAKETYKINYVTKKGNIDSARFRQALNNTLKKNILRDEKVGNYEKKAALHYKKSYKLTLKARKLEKRLEKAEHKTETKESIYKAAKTTINLIKNPKQAVKEEVEKKIRESKIGNAALNLKDDIRDVDKAAEADSLGEGTANVVMALPEKYIKNTVTKVIQEKIEKSLTGKGKVEELERKRKQVERKYGYEKTKAQRADRNAKNAKESAVRKAKVQYYKEEKGLSKSKDVSKNVKNGISQAVNKVGKWIMTEIKKEGSAIIGALGAVVLVLVLIIVVISSLFTWINPHEETIYVDETNTWETVKVETDKEVLNGYIRHIQDYFDKKQLEILEVVDNNFGGFTPDKYNYYKTESKDGELTFDEPPKLNTEYVVYSVNKDVTYKYVTGGAMGATFWSEPTVTSSTGENIIRKEFFKNDPDLGYEVRTTSFDYEFERVYLLCAVNIEQYWMSKGLMKYYDTPYIFTCENGKFSASQDITNEMIVLRRDGEIIYEGSAVTYIMSHPELFEHTAVVKITEPLHEILDTKCSWNEKKREEIIDDNQYVFENYIWNLYEYGNQWIKLSDDCDYESIIAMAAIKKWREIEADGFDPDTYTFEITDDDLDYCLNNLYDFSYGYKRGKCKYENCHKYYVDGAPFYKCDRATTHKHLIGEVTNLELAGGIDYVLNKILVPPKASDYSTTEEYNKAKEQFKTDKEIYKVYVEFIHDELGTSTKLPDYENNEEAQYRLLRMYQAKNGKKPSNPPTDVKCKPRKEWVTKTVYGADDTDMANSFITFHEWQNKTQYAYLDVSWTAPAEEKVSSEKKVEISGYKIYAYNSSNGSKKLLKTTVGDSTSCTIEYMVGDYCSETTYYTEEYYNGGVKKTRLQIATKTFRLTTLPRFVNIIVEAYNDAGSGPQSSPPVYVKIEED